MLSEALWPVLRGVPHVRRGKNNPASRPVSLAGWYRSRAVAVALGHRAERPLITIVHCQYAPRAGCSALRRGTTFLRRSRVRVRCASQPAFAFSSSDQKPGGTPNRKQFYLWIIHTCGRKTDEFASRSKPNSCWLRCEARRSGPVLPISSAYRHLLP